MTETSLNIYGFQARAIDGKSLSLNEFHGKVILIVNVASRCGFTKQYDGLEALYEKYKDKGFTILGFPCNQFGAQEPGDENEIQKFCSTEFKVTFPLFSKIEVNGADTHPLYQYLKSCNPGLLGTEGIKWNFTKFLINREGKPIARFAPVTEPKDLEKEIEKFL